MTGTPFNFTALRLISMIRRGSLQGGIVFIGGCCMICLFLILKGWNYA